MPSPEQQLAKTILIVDQDLGFVLWLGHTLALKGYLALPITGVPEAHRLIVRSQIAALHLLIVNPALPGTSDLVDTLRSRHGALKVIQIEDSDRGTTDLHEAQSEWIAMVREVLETDSVRR